ncbi:MAG: YIP1 family protein [Chloroflexota bacterium]
MSYDPQSGGNTEPTGGSTEPTGSGGTQPTGGGYTQPTGGGQPTQPVGGYTPPPGGGYTPPPPTPPTGGYTPPTPPPGGGYGGYGAPPPPPPTGGPERPAGGPNVNVGNMGTINQASLQDLFQSYMNALTKPNVSTYEGEIHKASWLKVLIGVTAVAIIGFIVRLIFAGAAMSSLSTLQTQLNNSNVNFDTSAFAGGVGVGGAFVGLIGTYITFFLGAGLLWLMARMFGGTGSDFMTHSYLLSISYTPLRIIASILSIIPVVGGIIGFAATLYQLYSAGLAMQASQRMQPGRAQLAAFLPMLVGIVLICLCAVLAVFGLAAAFSGTSTR